MTLKNLVHFLSLLFLLTLVGCALPTAAPAEPPSPIVEPTGPLQLVLGKQLRFSSSTPTCFVGFNLLDKGRDDSGNQLKSVVVTVLQAADLAAALKEGEVETIGVFFTDGRWSESFCQTDFELEVRDGGVFLNLSRPWHPTRGDWEIKNLIPFEWGMQVTDLHRGLE